MMGEYLKLLTMRIYVNLPSQFYFDGKDFTGYFAIHLNLMLCFIFS